MYIEKLDFVTEFWRAFLKCEETGDFDALLERLLATPIDVFEELNVEAALLNIYLFHEKSFDSFIDKFEMTTHAITLTVYRSRFKQMTLEQRVNIAAEIKDYRFIPKSNFN